MFRIILNNMKLIKLGIGEDYGDKTDSRYINSNLTKEELEEAYKIGTNIIGFDFCEDVAAESEDMCMTQRHFKAISKHITLKGGWEDYYQQSENSTIDLDTNSFCRIFLKIAKLGNPEFDYKFVEIDTIEIGGYGLHN